MARRGLGSIVYKRDRELWYVVRTEGPSRRGNQQRTWSAGYATRREAERALAELLVKGRASSRSKKCVREIVDAYITHVKGLGRAATTIQRYQGLARNFETVANEQVERLDEGRIGALYDHLRAEPLSETTIFHVHSLLAAACKWARARKLISLNPFAEHDIEAPRRARSQATALSTQDAMRFLQHIDITQYKNALLLALFTGMRRGEVLGLKQDCIDLHRRVALVRESRFGVIVDHHYTSAQKAPKSGQIREVPLSNEAIAALRAEEDRRESMRRAAGDQWTESGFLFVDSHGRPLAPPVLSGAFARVAKKANLPARYSLHSLRHTAATWMLASGMDLTTVQAVLGHSEGHTTLKTYSHVVAGRAAKAVSTIGQQLRRAGWIGGVSSTTASTTDSVQGRKPRYRKKRKSE